MPAKRSHDQFRCVVFDLDGTLINNWHLSVAASGKKVVSRFHQSMADTVALFERGMLRSMRGYDDKFLRQYRSLLHSILDLDKVFDFPFPGVTDMLRVLRAQRYLLGIVTEKSRDAWNVSSSRSDLTSFDVVVTADDVEHHKPDPEGLVAAMTALDVPPSQTIYIGDSLLDCEAARAVSVSFGAVLWSKDPNERERFASQA